MVHYVKGDLLAADVQVIGHQTNCMGKMGKGLALSLNKAYFGLCKTYELHCNSHGADNVFGTCQLVEVSGGKFVANLFGQYRYGTDKRYTDYDKLKSALIDLRSQMERLGLESVGLPSGLAADSQAAIGKLSKESFTMFSTTVMLS
jgi:O-acetyl-ADP-ribose deacetylase (regulator of RNase III)